MATPSPIYGPTTTTLSSFKRLVDWHFRAKWGLLRPCRSTHWRLGSPPLASSRQSSIINQPPRSLPPTPYFIHHTPYPLPHTPYPLHHTPYTFPPFPFRLFSYSLSAYIGHHSLRRGCCHLCCIVFILKKVRQKNFHSFILSFSHY
ncbi:MAG: hypothetical protein EAZ32_16465 [Cytophagia bacterium]|nr:MAG: hypothetical protein EAZ46_13500 [Runella sp.]TAG24884.1 MAG: hypothetical protein EAZ38_00600 [Cytophagales bacterium]TAG36812.1 MAG: hypothetical protein EAZ32_16465 [Cytophagia bacterium]TAG56570.1 MAG: hypothetical protein EAZ29_02900 [Runella slithyformis]TAG84378.1 MAG: hypothetical protein EAZ22_00760 [Cytophagales bacterium]